MKEQEVETVVKEAIISEYLQGGTSYRLLGSKYGYTHQRIHNWVTNFIGKKVVKKTKALKKEVVSSVEEELPKEIKLLQEELRKAKLYNKLLNNIIDIAEDQLKIDIRKKSGTKR
jgi:hypothetical protein